MSSKITLSLDWEQNVIETAKRLLDDIPVCRAAEYKIQWIDDTMASDKSKVPVLVIAFNSEYNAILPACGVRLSTAPNNTILKDDKLKGHIRNSIEHFLLKNNMWIPVGNEGDGLNIIVKG